MDGSLQALRETGSASTCVGRDRAVGHRADRRQNIAVTFIEPFRLRAYRIGPSRPIQVDIG
jgi:hypothetical protein